MEMTFEIPVDPNELVLQCYRVEDREISPVQVKERVEEVLSEEHEEQKASQFELRNFN